MVHHITLPHSDLTVSSLCFGASKAIVDAVVDNKKRITIGQDAKTMWALNRMNPDTAANLIYNGMKDLLS